AGSRGEAPLRHGAVGRDLGDDPSMANGYAAGDGRCRPSFGMIGTGMSPANDPEASFPPDGGTSQPRFGGYALCPALRGYRASVPDSPLRTRTRRSTATAHTLPSPILPVRPVFTMRSMIWSTSAVSTRTSIFTLGTKATAY